MERLGSNLEETIKTIGPHRLTLRNLAALICQMVSLALPLHQYDILTAIITAARCHRARSWEGNRALRHQAP